MSLNPRWFNQINDITTDFNEGPRFSDGAAYPASFREVQRRLYPDLQPLSSAHGVEEVFRAALQLIHDRNWKIQTLEERNLRVHAVAITPLLRFRDDVLIEVRESEGVSLVQMRSRSRLGRSDFGANFTRIRDFFADLKEALNE